MSIETELEAEIRQELEKLEQIFNEEISADVSVDYSFIESRKQKNSNNSRLSYSAYEYAQAEGEKEEMEDKLNALLSKNEDFILQVDRLNKINSDLQMRNRQLMSENGDLHQQVYDLQAAASAVASQGPSKTNGEIETEKQSYANLQLEMHLLRQETLSLKARADAEYRVLSLAKDKAMEELERERALRIHAGQ
jgi:hypothetical protein